MMWYGATQINWTELNLIIFTKATKCPAAVWRRTDSSGLVVTWHRSIFKEQIKVTQYTLINRKFDWQKEEKKNVEKYT